MRITGITINRFSGGKIVESWTNYDALGMLQQIGAVPEPGEQGVEPRATNCTTAPYAGVLTLSVGALVLKFA